MTTLTVTTVRKNRVQIVARRDGQLVQMPAVVTPGDGKALKKLAKQYGCSETDLAELCLAGGGEMEVQDAAAPAGDCAVTLRRIDQPKDTAVTYPNIGEALKNSIPEGVIEWDNREALCCLDIDYHTTKPPAAEWLLASAARLRPFPTFFWRSVNGGLHAVYTAQSYISAEELAAVAGLSWKSIDPLSCVELLTSTRVPPGEYTVCAGDNDLSAVAKFLGAAVPSDRIAEWLGDMGLEQGCSYEHNACPCAPGEGAHGKPVYVGEHGIICKKCEAGGKCFGSRRPGFFPWTAVVGGGPTSLIRNMVQHFCHWEHAKIVLDDRLKFTGETARLAWKAMLHLIHGDDPRVERVFVAGRNLIRLDKRWTTRDALATYDKNITQILAGLPACQTEEGAILGEQVARFSQNIDLDEEGYPTIVTIPGVRIYSQFLPFPDEKVTLVTPSAILRSPANEDKRPRYIPPEARRPDARQIIERAFPGIDWNYLQLLIAAKGCVESQLGLPPNIIVRGFTSTGKTTTTHIAAAICGDKCSELVWQSNTERFRQGYHTAAETGSYVCISEILKDAERQGSTAIQAMDIFLNLTPDTHTHKLFTGSLPLGRVPATIVTDVDIPQAIRNDAQIARRFVYVRLVNGVNWVESLVTSGVYRIERLRLAGEEYVAAANTILSEVIDRWFREPKTLVDIARDLGYNTLDQATDFDDPANHLKRLYELVHNQAESTDARWQGGWRLIRRGVDESELAQTWELLSDGNDSERWGSSRRCNECDWKRVLGKDRPIRCETRRHGAILGIRFVEG